MSEAMAITARMFNDQRYLCKSETRIRRNRIKRNRLYRRQMGLLIFTVTVVIFLSVLFASTFMSDARSNAPVEFKYYTTVTVKAGQTLSSIANDNVDIDHYDSASDYMKEICVINHLDTASVIKAGDNIVIPYYSEEFK